MPLSLIVGPANAGKVERLLARYLAALDREPVLIVPNRSDVEQVERELLARRGALLAGTIGTFDDLFERIAGDAAPALVTPAQRSLLVRRVLSGVSLNGLAASSRFAGFADELIRTIGELESGLVDPDGLDGGVAALYAAYRAELDRIGLWDRDLLRQRAAERLRSDLAAWRGEPVFAYGFEDLTGAQWALLEALAGRADVSVSLPYEPGRPAFASLRRTAEDLQRLAAGRIEELPASSTAHPALTHLERALFSDASIPPVASDGAVRFLEGAGTRGALELVGEEVLRLLRAGTPAERIGLVAPNVERLRAPLETAFGTLGIPYALDGEVRFAQTPFGQALTSLLRFVWLEGSRRELFTFLRSPFSGVERRAVDFVEGRLRGRAITAPDRVVEEGEKLHGRPFPALAELHEADDPLDAVRTLAARILRNAYGVEHPPAGETSRLDLRSYQDVTRLLTQLERWRKLVGELSREDIVTALERHALRPYRGDEPGRVAVLDLGRARTRRFDVVFVVGLEEGSLPRRGTASPFLDDDTRPRLDEQGSRLERPDPVSR